MSNLLEKASILLTPTAYDDGRILSVKPIDGSGDFDFTRNSSATRVNSAGLIESLQTLSSNLVSNGDFSQEGSELITNGDFATDTNWTKGTGWSISGGAASCDGTQTAGTQLVQNGTYTLNKTYKITYTLSSVTAGNIDVRLQGSGATVTGNSRTTDGTYTEYITSTGNTSFRIRGNDDFIGSIDNVSVKEVGQDWNLSTGWSIGDNKLTFDSNNITGNPTTFTAATIDIPIFVIGKKYRVTLTDLEILAGNVEFKFGRTFNSNPARPILTSADNGTYVDEFVAVSTSRSFTINNGGARVYGSIGSVSVIEITDDTNLPRIDYSPYSGAGTCGHWLFEPQSTNLWSNSEGSDITLTSPLGTFGFYNITSSQISNPEAFTAGTIVSATFIVKKADGTTPTVTASGSNGDIIFRITGTSGAGEAGTLTDIGNGFYTYKLENYSVSGNNSDNRISNNSGDVVYVSLVQLEQNSYATSYIPTSGSTVTRNQDLAFGSGSSSLINSTEGVLYAEIAALADDNITRNISLGSGTIANTVEIFYGTGSQNISFRVRANNSVVGSVSGASVTDRTQFAKVALKYKSGEIKGFINGLQVLSITDSFTFSASLSELAFDRGANFSYFEGKTKCVAVFKEALTDDELECLTSDETSFSSFNALALANNYTII